MINHHDIEDMRPDNAHPVDNLIAERDALRAALDVAEEALNTCKEYDHGMAGRGTECDMCLVENALQRINEITKG